MRIVVVGDVLLDRDIGGPSTRQCPDAPAPVIDVAHCLVRAGGAGLTARLLALDGHSTTLVTALSDDEASRELRSCLSGLTLVAGGSNAPTPVKTRVLHSGRVLARLDEGCQPTSPPVVTAEMIDALAAADAILVSDYGRGLSADPGLRAALAHQARRVPLVWDPPPRGAEPVAGAAAVPPNLREARGAAGTDLGPDANIGAVAAALRQRWRCQALVVTLGDAGAWLDSGPDDGRALAAVPLDGVDTCGAGDRFASRLAAGLAEAGRGHRPAAQPGIVDAVSEAIAATGSFLRAGGVAALPAPPTPRWTPPGASSLRAPAPQRAGRARELVSRLHATGGTVVATGGCFDLLHAGHLRTLRAARAQGDALIVCLNSDRSVRALKGPQRPLMGQEERAELLEALDCVDAVVVFDEDTPVQVLTELRPDVWVKGGDYVVELLPEYELVTGWGGRCATVPFHPGHSTSSLVTALERIGPDAAVPG